MKKVALAAVSALALASCGSETSEPQGNVLQSGEGDWKSTAAMPPVTAEGYLKLKPGLWVRTARALGQNLGEDRICIDETVYKLMQPKRDIERVNGDCDDVKQDAGTSGITFSTVCRKLGEAQIEGVLSGTDQELRTTLKSRATATGKETEFLVESKWAGACPAGMKAGETES